MAIRVTDTAARAHLAEWLERATEDREPIVITRHGSPAAILSTRAAHLARYDGG
ncbi:MAG TPA: type II toxin-antitoxin system Phd/YefM family antitoxin [Chloroflexota bacterium]|nr:type II toxin-antitoxin system Phd/YefM family antitoxin [Chloroflexota bacterium]